MLMEQPKMIAPARSAEPLSRAAGQRTELQSRRRELLRKGTIVGVSVTLAAIVIVAASFVGTHLIASWWIQSHQGNVVWEMDDSNWRQGGVTSVAFAPRRFSPSLLGDADLVHVHRLFPVVSLNLSDNDEISDKGLAGLRGLDYLNELSLDRLGRFRPNSFGDRFPVLTDACLVHVQALPRLESLSLAGNKITDQGLSQLAAMPRLKSIDLSATEITDAGLTSLEGMKTLEWVNLGATHVSIEGILKFRTARPDVTVDLEVDPVVAEGVKSQQGQKP